MSRAFVISIAVIVGFVGGYGLGYSNGYAKSTTALELEAVYWRGKVDGAKELIDILKAKMKGIRA